MKKSELIRKTSELILNNLSKDKDGDLCLRNYIFDKINALIVQNSTETFNPDKLAIEEYIENNKNAFLLFGIDSFDNELYYNDERIFVN